MSDKREEEMKWGEGIELENYHVDKLNAAAE